MTYSPCLNPIHCFNESLGTYVSVPCGHCDACLCNKGYTRKLKIEEQFLRYRYRFFVTLTFSDENLPLATFNEDEQIVISGFDKDYLGVYYHKYVADFSDDDLKFLVDTNNKFGGIPVLSRSEICKFKKRLRYYLSKYGKDLLYISSCGEYGPTTFRPHYHVLIGTNSEQYATVLEQCCIRAWSPRHAVEHKNKQGFIERTLGIIDFQRCTDAGCANYCASYLSCTTHLPRIYRELPFCPFLSQSTDVGFADRQSLPTLQQSFDGLVSTFTYVSPKSTEGLLLALPIRFLNRYWPRVPGYCKIPCGCLIGVYRIPLKVCNFLSTATEFSQSIIEGWRNGAFVDRDIKFLYWLYDFYHADYKTLFNKLKLFYYRSRQAYRNACELGVTLYDYLNRMQLFYSKLALNRLRDFYEFQCDLLSDFYNPLQLSQLFGLYKSTDYDHLKNLLYYFDQFGVTDAISTISPHQHLVYAALRHKIIKDTTKTKKRNDEFEKRGLQRPVFVPHLKRSIINFLKV